ncbi:MAG TPA: hypothetical protein ENK02_15955 [Planctomycetes bacterium]|nr:hypothetical protein [Planctomycetota bacterium]
MDIDQNNSDELFHYTLAHDGSSFIHQNAVDAISAQTAKETEKPIQLAFALVGLYLHVEKHWTGREVQVVHMKLGRRKRKWPVYSLPETRGKITVKDVMAAPPGPERDGMIHRWCHSVWEAFSENRQSIVSLLKEYKIV